MTNKIAGLSMENALTEGCCSQAFGKAIAVSCAFAELMEVTSSREVVGTLPSIPPLIGSTLP